jgi:transketolase
MLIMGDIGGGLFLKFKADLPGQIFNIGVCEQATVSIAAGLAMRGFRPVIYTITPFLIERAFEQIKVDIHLQRIPVGLVGHADTTEGPTHHPLDAKILMGLCPNIRSMFPETKAEARQFMDSLDLDKPWFLCLKPEQK